jgi:hypothetical protein
MCKPMDSESSRHQRRVSFSPVTENAAAEPDNDRQQPPAVELTKRERKGLWYSKRELAESRREVKRTIIAIHEQGGIDLLHYCDKLQQQDEDEQLEEQDQLCFRGCERYYSSLGRSQVVQDFRQAVLEAQNHTRGQPNCLGQVSNILSQSNKELAAWYAKLNAADCWGQQQLAEQQQQPMEQQQLEQSQSPFVKTTATMVTCATTSSPATGKGYRMTALV